MDKDYSNISNYSISSDELDDNSDNILDDALYDIDEDEHADNDNYDDYSRDISLLTPYTQTYFNNSSTNTKSKKSKKNINYKDYVPYNPEFEVNDDYNNICSSSNSNIESIDVNIVNYEMENDEDDINNIVNVVDTPIKVIIIGNSSVGKSNLMTKFTKNKFNVTDRTTIGVEFDQKKVVLDNTQFNLHIWDTAGQELFDSITKSYYRDSTIAIIVYDVSDYKSFESVRKWHKNIQNNDTTDSIKVIGLVGNKIDKDNRVVMYEEGESLANKISQGIESEDISEEKIKGIKCMFFESSAKSGYNVSNIFEELLSQVKDEHIEKNNSIKLKEKESSYNGYLCC